MKFDHVGMLVHDIEAARAACELLGYDEHSERFSDPRQGIDIMFLWRADDVTVPRLELVQPTRESSVVSNLLQKSGATPYHLCFHAMPLAPELERLHERGYAVLGEAMPSPAFAGALFCFLYHRELGLVELVERD